MTAIQTQGLTKRFRQLQGYRDLVLYPWRRADRTAVDGVDLTVEDGEIFGLLGENGAGKTTLIRMLSTTLIPTEGRAVVGGHDVGLEPHAVRRQIGLVTGDERSFYWRLTGRQNLDFFAALYHVPQREADRRIDALLETLGVADASMRAFHTYSTGMRQKFAIARGLLTEPRILILDEPTRALDPIAADDVRRYIVEHISRRLGTTVLIATHTLSEADQLCHRVGILRHGRLIAHGTPAALAAAMTLTRRLDVTLAPGERVDGGARAAFEGFDMSVRVDTQTGTVLRISVGSSARAMTQALEAVVRSGLVVESTVTQQPTLDDVYRAAHAP